MWWGVENFTSLTLEDFEGLIDSLSPQPLLFFHHTPCSMSLGISWNSNCGWSRIESPYFFHLFSMFSFVYTMLHPINMVFPCFPSASINILYIFFFWSIFLCYILVLCVFVLGHHANLRKLQLGIVRLTSLDQNPSLTEVVEDFPVEAVQHGHLMGEKRFYLIVNNNCLSGNRFTLWSCDFGAFFRRKWTSRTSWNPELRAHISILFHLVEFSVCTFCKFTGSPWFLHVFFPAIPKQFGGPEPMLVNTGSPLCQGTEVTELVDTQPEGQEGTGG